MADSMGYQPLKMQTPEGIFGVGHQPTIEEQLKGEKEHLMRRLVDINDALEALEAHPELLRVMNLVSKAQRGF